MNLEQIREAMWKRMLELKPLVDEHEQLTKIAAVIEEVAGPPAPEAPYGYKADGTPRKRPDYSTKKGKERSLQTRRRKAKEREAANIMPLVGPKRETVKLNVQTVTGPTKDEMKDREVAHVSSGVPQ